MSDFEFFFSFYCLLPDLSVAELATAFARVSEMWDRLGLPGSGQPIWK